MTCIGLVSSACGPRAVTSGSDQPDGDWPADSVTVRALGPGVYLHTSYLPIEGYGPYPCNGLVVVDGGEAIVLDAPIDSAAGARLLAYTDTALAARTVAVVAHHFHDDCTGGLPAFHSRGIPSYGLAATLALAAAEGNPVPTRGFADTLTLLVGERTVEVSAPGPGHAPDNVVSYVAPLPGETGGVLFGGCLVKPLGGRRGNLADADTLAWPRSVAVVQQTYPHATTVVPGHGTPGGPALLDYTRELFGG